MSIVITHAKNGVYLGNFIGLGIWSKLDSGGQSCAVTFESEVQARDHIHSFDGDFKHEDFRLVSVQSEHRYYATIAECVAAGLDAWDPES